MSSPDVSHRDSGFVRFIIHYYRKWGYFISKHDWKAILIVLVISSLFNLKVLTTKQKNDITGNADYNARSRVEYEKYKEFFASNGWGVATYVFLLAKDEGSMIRERYLNETLQILDLVSTNLTIFDKETNSSENFKQFCISFCNINDPIIDFYNGLQLQSNLAQNGEPYSAEIKLTYPISNISGREVNLMQNFFGVEFDKSGKNGSMQISELKMVKMVVFQLRAEQKDGWTEDDVQKYEMDVVKFLNNNYKSENLKIYVLSKTYVEDEMVRATNSSMPYLAIGFLVMCVCSVISVLISASYMHQRNYMKIVLAVLACVLPFMSCATAMGILFLCGVRFASILVVIPFLVLAIAVDSSYLLIHEWQHVVQRCREHPGPQTSDVGYRLSEVLAEVGPSILISALTNILADFVGLFTSSEEITILCFGTLVAMVVAFVYQMTFYIGLMSRMGRHEIANEEKETLHINGNTLKSQAKTEHFITKIIQGYVNFLSNKIVALTILGIYVVYIVFSILGITQININLTTQKLFALDSPLIELDKLRVDYQVPQYSMATVFVSNLGNLSDTKLQDLGSLVNSLENLTESWGTVGTRFFLREFLSYENEYSPEGNELDTIPKEDIVKNLSKLYNPDDLRSFIAWPEYTYYRGFIKFKNDTNELDRFFFTTAYHGENLKIWAERAKMLNQWRDTIDNYSSKFDVSVFHEDGIFLDLIEYMPTNTFQSVVGILGCMAFICLIFLKSFFTVIISSAAVLSIFTGLLGSLSYLNMDLDPITMAAMIIALGYSVDIPAHISFHYHQAGYHEINPTPQQRLVKTFSSVAFPVIQAGLSTCICVCSLLFIRLYMAQVFVKSTVLTVLLCNLHGLVFLPVFIILFNWILERHGKLNKVQDNNNHLDTFKTTTSKIGSP